MRNLLIALFVLFSFPALATNYYFSNSGSGTACTIGSPCTDTYAQTVITSAMTVDDVLMWNKGEVYTGSHNIGSTSARAGTAGHPITFTSYGTGAKPIFNNLTTFAPTWTLVSGAIYSAPQSAGMLALWRGMVTFLTDDGVRVDAVPWNTNVATTLATMTAGTYFQDYTNSLIYIWLADSSDPTGSTIAFPANQSYFAGNKDGTLAFGAVGNAGFYTFDGFDFRNANSYAISCGGGTESAYACKGGITVQNCDFSNNGRGAINLSGGGIIQNNTAFDSGGSYANNSYYPAASGNTGVYHVNQGAFQVLNNTSDYTRQGTHLEVSYGAINTTVSGNHFTRGSVQCFESNGGGTNSNILFEKNYCDQRGNPANSYGFGILFSGTTTTTAKNNIIIQGTKGSASMALLNAGTTGNFVYNNTFIRQTDGSATAWDLQSDSNASANAVKNNIFVNLSATPLMVRCDAGTCGAWDNNLFYNASGTFTYKWHGAANATTLAGWQAASGLDIHSINSNPLLDANYKPQQGSPAINAGTTIASVTDDYTGFARPYGAGYDIGAFEVMPVAGLRFNGVRLNGVRVK